MTNKKTTKRALIASVISLMLCFTMLLGTTYAWFTDSVTSTNNIITSGNLDVELYFQKEGETAWTKVTDKTNVFMENTLWEPGHTEVVKLKVVNEGSLALKYQLGVNIADEVGSVNVKNEEFKLSDFIKFGIVDGSAKYTREEAIAAVDAKATALNVAYASDVTKLLATEEKVVTMVVYMPTTVGNDANYAKDAAVPTIKLGLNLLATQVENESDSFGNDYDADAIFCDVLATPETIDSILAQAEAGMVIGLSEGYYDEIMITQDELTIVSTSAVVGFLNVNAHDNVTVDGLTFDQTGAKATYTFKTGNVQTATGTVANITGDTNSPKAADGLTVKNCTFTNASGVATVANESYVPIFFNEQGAATERASDITIENCVFACNATQYITLNYLSNGYAVIRDNIFGSATYGTSHNTINASGNAASWTITGNSFNNWNIEKTAIGSSKQGSNKVTWTITDNEFNHKDGAVILALKTSYTADNSVVTVANNKVLGDKGTIVTTDVNAENETVYGGHKLQLNENVALANSTEEMGEAITSGKTNIVLGTGVFVLSNEAKGKTLTISGTSDPEDTVIATDTSGSYEGCRYELDGSTVVFENITITTDSKTYTGYARCNATYNNCIINGTYTLYGNSEFNNCTFNVSGDVYNIWTWGAPNAVFNNCTFNSDGKAMLLYGTENTNLTLNNCVFNDNGGLTDLKAAVEIGNDYGKSYTLTVNNTVVNGYEINDKGINTGTTLWANKNSMGTDKLNVVVDGVDVY